MQAIGIENLIRVSFGIYNTTKDIDIFCEIIKEARSALIS
jgi:selenocysteine lyase/cysteine desulfurase